MADTRFVDQKAVGLPVLPDEAIPLVEGDGRFLNDIGLPGMYHTTFLRSQHAHARIRSVDTAKASDVARRNLGADRQRAAGKSRAVPQHAQPFFRRRIGPALACRRQGPVLRRGGLRSGRGGSRHRGRCGGALSKSMSATAGGDQTRGLANRMAWRWIPRHLPEQSPDQARIRARQRRRGIRSAYLVVKRKFRIGRKQALCLETRAASPAIAKDASA